MKKEYTVSYSVTGHCSAVVEATSKEEAEDKARNYDVVDGSDELIEWSFDEFLGVEE